MKPGENGGYKLENSIEIMAALWNARATGSGLDDFILKSRVWVPTGEASLTSQVDLDESLTRTLVNDCLFVLENKADTRPEYRQAARLMLAQFLEDKYEPLSQVSVPILRNLDLDIQIV